MTIRRFSTIIFALLLAGCGRSEPVNGPATDPAANGTANGAVVGNDAAPPPGPDGGNGAIVAPDNNYHSTVPPGNTCGYRTVTVPCPGAPTRTCQQIVEGPPCPSGAPR